MTSSAPVAPGRVPAAPYIQIDADGQAWLQGSRCSHCDAVLLSRQTICPQCSARDGLQPIELARHGTLYNYTIVHRSFPGVKTPFIAATVDLAGGGTLKGVLEGVPPDIACIRFDMPVRLVFRETGQRDAEGRPYLAHVFLPAEEGPP